MNFNKITLAALMALLYAACTDENGSLGAMGGAEQKSILRNMKVPCLRQKAQK